MLDKIAGYTIRFEKEVHKTRKLEDFRRSEAEDSFFVIIPNGEVKHLIAATSMGENYRGIAEGELLSLTNFRDEFVHKIIDFAFLKREAQPEDIEKNTTILELIYATLAEMGDFNLILIGNKIKQFFVGFIAYDENKKPIESAVLLSFLEQQIGEFTKEIIKKA